MKNSILLLKTLFVTILIIAGNVNVWGQTQLFYTDMGKSAIAAGSSLAILSGAYNDVTCSGDVAVTTTPASTVSSGYDGASGDGYLDFSAGKYFEITGINTSNYTDIFLSFGIRKSSTAASEIVVEYNTGSGYMPLSYSVPTGGGTTGWYLMKDLSIPTTSLSMSIRFTLGATVAATYRIDDVKIIGTPVASGTITQLTAPQNVVVSNNIADAFDVLWDANTDASGYTINVYKDGTFYQDYSVSGGSTSTYHVKYIMPDATTQRMTCTVIAEGDNIDFSSSDESAESSEFSLVALDGINVDFGDGLANGFDVTSGTLTTVNKACETTGAAAHTGAIVLSNGGTIVLPAVKNIEQIEIHAFGGGTSSRSFKVETSNDGISWYLISSYDVPTSADKINIIEQSILGPVKLRITNTMTGGANPISFEEIVVRSVIPIQLDAPSATAATGIASITSDPNNGFYANWTPVSNATGYKVTVTQVAVSTTTTVYPAGQVTNLWISTGTTRPTGGASTFSYTVVALGDGLGYLDSPASNTVTVVPDEQTSIQSPSASANILSVKYYTLTGIEVQQPVSGIFIQKVIYDNGAVETIKVIK